MCATCGCSGDGKAKVSLVGHKHDHDHLDDHDHQHDHSHDHEHDHAHAHHHEGESVLTLERRILAKNDALAERNRAWVDGREILMLNLVSAPGSGKTTLLERTITHFRDRHAIHVIEGDQATENDAMRIRAAGAPVVQVNTGTGCHLEAQMVAEGLLRLRPERGALVLVENVGNLVCPALFDLGESAKVVILSVTEGEDKPLKYPHMFRAAALMILNKIDLLPHVEFDVARCIAHAREVNPEIEVLQLSARTGEGMEAWYRWLELSLAGCADAALPLQAAEDPA
ncbi:MAG TPA: hydrogenase nickel incorporation protein HypB [Candidatus Cybelea sp.]|nr:hydrogenase nickel incorporation protein HypB [Candidatus Cybelea sp.]